MNRATASGSLPAQLTPTAALLDSIQSHVNQLQQALERIRREAEAAAARTGAEATTGDPTRPLLLRVTEAAEMLGISRTKAYEMVRSQELLSVRLGGDEGQIRIPRRWLEQHIDRLMTEAIEHRGTNHG